MGSIVFAVFYIVAIVTALAGSLVIGEFFLGIVLRHSARLRRFFDELPMNCDD